MGTFWFYALIIATVIVVFLAIYARKLVKQLTAQKEQQDKAALAQQNALNGHDKKVFQSILLITRAMEEEQCEFDEGCWRLSVLLASLKTIENSEVETKFTAIFALYNEISSFSIMKDRKNLAKKERMQQDFKRMSAEANLHDDIVKDLGVLHQYARDNINRLTA